MAGILLAIGLTCGGTGLPLIAAETGTWDTVGVFLLIAAGVTLVWSFVVWKRGKTTEGEVSTYYADRGGNIVHGNQTNVFGAEQPKPTPQSALPHLVIDPRPHSYPEREARPDASGVRAFLRTVWCLSVHSTDAATARGVRAQIVAVQPFHEKSGTYAPSDLDEPLDLRWRGLAQAAVDIEKDFPRDVEIVSMPEAWAPFRAMLAPDTEPESGFCVNTGNHCLTVRLQSENAGAHDFLVYLRPDGLGGFSFGVQIASQS